MTLKRIILSNLVIASITGITACGGGGGDNPKPNPGPVGKTYQLKLDRDSLDDTIKSTKIQTIETKNSSNSSLSLASPDQENNSKQLDEENISYQFSSHKDELKLSYSKGSQYHILTFSPKPSDSDFYHKITIKAILKGQIIL